MIFWILLVITALVMIAVVVFSTIEEGGWGFLAGLGWAAAVAFFGACISFIVLLICIFAGWSTGSGTQTAQYDEKLRSLSTGDGIEGRFYLGYGRVDGENVFNYIVERDGYSTLERADADDVRVFEDESANPYVTVTEADWGIWWAVPWPVGHWTEYDFHIPEGSVSGGYEVTP